VLEVLFKCRERELERRGEERVGGGVLYAFVRIITN
jgi:hypothetical protein